MEFNNFKFVIMNIKNRIKFSPPFLLILFCSMIVIFLLIVWLLKGFYSIGSIIILIISLSCLSYRKSVKVSKEKCEFYYHFLFFKFGNRKIEFREIKEIIVIIKINNQKIKTFAPRSAGYKYLKNETAELVIINSQSKNISIIKSIKQNEIHRLAKLFSEYFNITIQHKKQTNNYPEKEFTGGII